MSENSLKWIPLGGMNLSAANLAAAEKLRRFGFALMFNEFGSEKMTKTGLCIYDVLADKERPNILLITSNTELYSWHRILMTGIGADFKIISGSSNAIVFFSKDCPNLYLMSADALGKSNGLKAKAGSDFVWDLIIIDEERTTGVPDYGYYQQNIPWKCERLLMTATRPVKKEENIAQLKELLNSLLVDASDVESIELSLDAAKLDADSPVMRYFDQRVYNGSLKRNISIREYSFQESSLTGLRRRMDLKSGLPLYKHGGNIFEDYDCELKSIYQKNSYTRPEVEELRSFDKKLDSFITLMEEILADENNRAMVYCCEKNTMEYLRKVISCLFGKSIVKTDNGELYNNSDIIRKLQVDDKMNYARVVIGVDSLGAVGEAFDRIGYIVNYELPSSSAVLERRMTRHGAKGEAERQFIIFRDTNKLFDSRMLDKVMYAGLSSGFCCGLPSRSILLDIPNKAEYMGNVFDDLKYVVSYANEVDSCFDLIKKFKGDYAAFGTEKITTAKQLAEFSDKLLERVCKTIGVDKSASRAEVEAAVAALDGLCVINDGRLEKVPADKLAEMSESFDNDSWKSLPFASEAVNGVAEAKKHIDELHAAENFHLNVKNELSELVDSVQYPVLFGIWRYRVREQDSRRSFRDYIKIYNDGI